MAVKLYPKFKERVWQGYYPLLTAAVHAKLLSSSYTYNSAHTTSSDLAGVVATTADLGTKVITNSSGAIFGSASPTASSVSGSQITQYALLLNGSGNYLIGHYDAAASGLPYTPTGVNITIAPDATLKWFRLEQPSYMFYSCLSNMLEGKIDCMSYPVRIVLVDETLYTYSSAHDALDDIPAAARIATSFPLQRKTFTDGLFTSDPGVFFRVPTAATIASYIVYQVGLTEATSYLISRHNFADGLPMLVTPEGNHKIFPNATNGWGRIV